jgi:hypothetical protein
MIPKAQHLDFPAGEKTIAHPVTGALIRKTVTAAIQFHRQPCRHTKEIEKINAAGILPAKFETGKSAITQLPPQAFLGSSGRFSEMAGEVPGRNGARAPRSPHPGPLPFKGRGNRNLASDVASGIVAFHRFRLLHGTHFSSASACLRAASLWPPSIRASSVTRAFLSSKFISEIVRPFFTCLVTT